ncbi:MAG: YkgJ family cysteine cluster protein [Thermoguttaceae bacterium]
MDSDSKWYKKGLQFECKQCGQCCGGGPGYVWVSDEEIEQIAKKMGLDRFLFEQTFVWTVKKGEKSLKEYGNGDCVLLHDRLRGCKVYQERPIQCRTWPFWEINIHSESTWKKAGKHCPGINNGRLYTFDEIEEQRLAFRSPYDD